MCDVRIAMPGDRVVYDRGDQKRRRLHSYRLSDKTVAQSMNGRTTKDRCQRDRA
jgi:hypothetical protein